MTTQWLIVPEMWELLPWESQDISRMREKLRPGAILRATKSWRYVYGFDHRSRLRRVYRFWRFREAVNDAPNGL